MTGAKCPGSLANGTPSAGPNVSYAYDTMGRLNTMTDVAASQQIVTGATYGPSNELLTMSGTMVNETPQYNSMGQLMNLALNRSGDNKVNITYNLSGEQVVYSYDALKRAAIQKGKAGKEGHCK